jgi:hypothetical protein
MQLTLWQQFSSNHSSLFYVVGEFASHQSALHARAALVTLFQEGMAVFDDNDAFGETTYGQLVEDQYAIDVPLDYVTFVVGNLLIAHETIDTWTYKAPVEALLKHVHAQSITGYDMDNTSDFVAKRLDIKFTAPDEAAALRLDAQLSAYFASMATAPTTPPPWMDVAGILAQTLPISRYLHADSVARLQQRWTETYTLMTRGNHEGPSAQNMRSQLAAFNSPPQAYHRTALAFQITGVFFVETLGLAGFIAWLEQQGCTDIHLRYV